MRLGARSAPAAPDELSMTIDLTGPTPTLESTCDCCGRVEQLFRLIGTAVVLCRGCFARKHG